MNDFCLRNKKYSTIKMNAVFTYPTEPIEEQFQRLIYKRQKWWDFSRLWSKKWIYRVYSPKKRCIKVFKTNVEITTEKLSDLESSYPGYRITREYKPFIN